MLTNGFDHIDPIFESVSLKQKWLTLGLHYQLIAYLNVNQPRHDIRELS